MSDWRHAWSYPFILILTWEGEEGEKPFRVATLAQECSRCAARRNPRSNGFHSWGTNARATCHSPHMTEKEIEAEKKARVKHGKILERLEKQLSALRKDGFKVMPEFALQQRGRASKSSGNRELALG